MKACVLRGDDVVVDTLPDPAPGPGEVVGRVLACGICGSDVHFRRHGAELTAVERACGSTMLTREDFDPTADVVMGHEFAVEVVAVGRDVDPRRLGTTVTSIPMRLTARGPESFAYSNTLTGALAEYLTLTDRLLLDVPEGLAPELAATTEPMACGVHAVARARVTAGDTAVVIGCGPVGLAVIAALRRAGVDRVIATDFSSDRRVAAEAMGATFALDPRQSPPLDAWRELGVSEPPVVFEAVGAPGILNEILTSAPRGSRVCSVGLCMERDSIQPAMAVLKEMSLVFAFAYTLDEFAATLDALGDGSLDPRPTLSASVGLAGVRAAFDSLERAEHVKVLARPSDMTEKPVAL